MSLSGQFLDHTTTGDGLLTTLQVLSAMIRKNRPLSELTQAFEHFPQVMLNVPVSRRLPLDELDSFQEQVKRVEAELGDSGRVLVRYSGTELKARVMVEGESTSRVQELAHDLADGLKRALASA